MDRFQGQTSDKDFAAVNVDQDYDFQWMIRWGKIFSLCHKEISSLMFWGLISSRTKILEGKAEYPHRSRMSKHDEETRCCFVVIYGGPETCEGGI